MLSLQPDRVEPSFVPTNPAPITCSYENRSSKFQEALSTWPQPVAPLVLRQLCTLLAASVGAAGGEGASALVTQALQQAGMAPSAGAPLPAPASSALALELLTAVALEAEDLDRVRRLALVNVLQPRARELLGALGALLEAAAAAQRGKHEGPSLPEIPSMLPLR